MHLRTLHLGAWSDPGALPLATGHCTYGRFCQPLGLIIVGGLIFSQIITLYITPAIFPYLEAFQEKVLDRYPFFRSHRATHVGIHSSNRAGSSIPFET